MGTECKFDVFDVLGGCIFLPALTPRVTHVRTMAFYTVMGSLQEGPLSHSHTVCIQVCVCDKLSLVLSH